MVTEAFSMHLSEMVEQEEIQDTCCEKDDNNDGSNSLKLAGVSLEELAMCVSVLQRLDAVRDQVDWSASCLRGLRKALVPYLQSAYEGLPQKNTVDASRRAKMEKNNKRERKLRQQEADKKWKENAELRASRMEKLAELEQNGRMEVESIPLAIGDAVLNTSVEPADDQKLVRIPDGPATCLAQSDCTTSECVNYSRQQACYTCKVRFSERHHFYSHLCPVCAELNFSKRNQHVDLSGRVCLITGARVKIGFQTALKLLRMGARVIATTRFPADAQSRYLAESDSSEWIGRLTVLGADFRFLGGVEALCDELSRRESCLDIIINNACQTIRRPAAYYAHLVEGERTADKALLGWRTSDHDIQNAANSENANVSVTVPKPTTSGFGDSAAMSQLAVLAEDSMNVEQASVVLPPGERDAHGQQLDTRSTNSWLLRLGEISTPEAVEVFCINTLTPFILNGRLRPLMERSPHKDRYIINVSAMEGKFYRYKQPTHPHTNMAKAALNMMTRTSAEDYMKQSGIYMNSVDTGWINDENPLPTARRIATEHGFQTPIDEIDAAARLLDPVVSGIMSLALGQSTESPDCDMSETTRKDAQESGPIWGRFLKDFLPTEW